MDCPTKEHDDLNQLLSRNFIGLLTELETDRGQTLLFGGLGQMGRGTPEYGEWRGARAR